MHDMLATFAATCGRSGLDLVAFAPASLLNDGVEVAHRLDARAFPAAAVVGNSRALWEPFLAALCDDDALYASADPLDAYVERAVAAAVAACSARAEVRFAHRRPFPPIRRFAQVAGLGAAGKSGLVVHPTCGPWIALRAVVAFDVDAADLAPVPAPPCPACDEACGTLLDDPLAARLSCPLGQTERYSDLQLAYHTTKDRRALARAVSFVKAARAPARR